MLSLAPVLREAYSHIAKAVLSDPFSRKVQSDTTFSAPVPLAKDYLPFDSVSRLTDAERDQLEGVNLPAQVTLSRREFTLMQRRSSSLVTAVSVLCSLFSANISQLGKQDGPSEEDFVFHEDTDPADVGSTLQAMNRCLASLARSASGLRVSMTQVDREALLAFIPILDSVDWMALGLLLFHRLAYLTLFCLQTG